MDDASEYSLKDWEFRVSRSESSWLDVVDFSSKRPVDDLSNRKLGPVASPFLLTSLVSSMAVGGHVIKVVCSALDDSRVSDNLIVAKHKQ